MTIAYEVVFQDNLKDIAARYWSLEAVAAERVVQEGALLIDIRRPEEVGLGTPASAVAIPRDNLEKSLFSVATSTDQPIVLICESGTRSLCALPSLEALGFRKLGSVKGGFQSWQRQGLPVKVARKKVEESRYARHLTMPAVGPRGQDRLARAKVLVVGAGGLGCPALAYLAAAGVGRIGVVDGDTVELSNLQRQILHTEERVGWPKVASAKAALSALNPHVSVSPYNSFVSEVNAGKLASEYDIIIDGTDNYDARVLMAASCARFSRPYIYGSVYQFEGQIGVFPNSGSRDPCYGCYQPLRPSGAVSPDCASAGVLGVLPGVIGSIQALEAIKLVLGIRSGLQNRVAHFDGTELNLHRFCVERRETCRFCGTLSP